MRYIVCILLIVLSGHFAMAQDKVDSFNKAVDYCNCRVTYAYLNQLTSAMSEDKPEKKSFQEIRAELIKCELGSSLEYDKLSDLLDKNNFKTSNQKVSAVIEKIKGLHNGDISPENATKLLIDGIFLNKDLQNIVTKFTDVAKQKSELHGALIKYFEGASNASGITDLDSAKRAIEIGTQNERLLDAKIAEHKKDFLYLCLYSILISLAVTTIVVLVIRGSLMGRLNRHRNEIDNTTENIKAIIANVNQLNDALKIKKEKWGSGVTYGATTDTNVSSKELQEFRTYVDNKLSDLIESIQRIQRDGSNNGKSNENKYAAYSAPYVSQSNKAEIFFASIPNKDGSFSDLAITKAINPTASFYKFTMLDAYSQKASFEFLNEERAIKDATNAPERILRPVCKIVNALNQNATRIKTLTPGTVTKQNDKWILNTPAEIEYE